MPVTIKVNGSSNSLVHKGSNGVANSTVPDVCKTPSPGGPVPVPYPIIVSMSSDLANGSTTVTADGGNMIAIKGCEFSRCTGDEPGTAGGVKSSTFMKEAKFILYSFDVKFDGQNACRLTDKMTMNHENTVCMQGVIQAPLTPLEMQLQVIATDCNRFIDTVYPHRDCRVRGIYKHKCCKDTLGKSDPTVQPEHSVGPSRLDVAVLSSPGGSVVKIYDYKFNCPPNTPKMSTEQSAKYATQFPKALVQLIGP
jgi:hypothetical protein